MPDPTTATTTNTTGTDPTAASTTNNTTAPAPTLLESSSLVKPDGTLVDGWDKSELLPEDVRGHKSLGVIKTFPDLIKRTINAESMVGKNKVAVPTDKSTPAEWEAFYTAGGRPKSPDDYQVEIPADMKSLFTDERLASARKLAHTLGISQKQFEGYMKGELESATNLLAEQERAEEQQKAEDTLALKKELGAAYDERLHVGNRLVAEAFGNDKEGEMAFLQEFGNNPAFIRFAAKVGAKLVEHKALVAELTQHSPREAETKIKELRATPGYMELNSKMTSEERQRITEQIRELTKLAYPGPSAR